ncbi:hypothetical protein P5V15_005735 [Pogonomyrmex californicus]
MLSNFLREYNINRVFLSITGCWPFQNKLVRNSLRTLCFLLEISYCPFEVLLLYDHWNDAQMIFEAGYQIAIMTSFILRQANQFWNYDKLRHLYKTIDEHWNIFTNDIEIQILKDYSSLSRKFTKYYSTIVYLMCLICMTIPLAPPLLDIVMPLNESRSRFFVVEVEFRMDKNENFVLIYCYTTVTMMVGINIMVGVDAMHVLCTIHACSLFAAISKQLENMFLKADNSKNINKPKHYINTEFDSLSEEIVYREYIVCLKKHQLAIEFVNVLESSYQGFSLLILLLIIGALSLIGIRIIYALDQLQEAIKLIFILIGILLTLTIISYSGQRIMDESQDIFYRAYAAEWYNFSPRLKSLMIITLYRSNVPCGLKAGNMIPLSIATYASVIKMAMSYFTAFLSLQE